MEKGCLVTEMVSQGTVLPYCFPKRNRLIAALADATVVIQARLGSGALHTARFAQRAGKPVLAVPGPVLDPLWAGSNQLLREGGEVLTGPEQCLLGTPGGADECRPRGTTWSASDLPPAIPRIPRNDLDKPGAFCLDLLARGVQHTDDLVAQTGWSSGALSRVLLQLEMKGLVVMRPGNLYEATVVVEE
jgi:DNA processing protein